MHFVEKIIFLEGHTMHVLAVNAEWECTIHSFNLQVQVQDEISDLNNLHTQQVYQ